MAKLVEITGSIYILSDMEDNIFYVGSTRRSLESRLTYHVSESKAYCKYPEPFPGMNHTYKKIADLNFAIKARVVHTAQYSGKSLREAIKRLLEAEMDFMMLIDSMGHALTNRFFDNKEERIKRSMIDNNAGWYTVSNVGNNNIVKPKIKRPTTL